MYFLCILYSSLFLAVHVSGAIAPILRSTTVAYGHRCVDSFRFVISLEQVLAGKPSHFNTVSFRLKLTGQYLLQWTHKPKTIYIPMAVRYSCAPEDRCSST